MKKSLVILSISLILLISISFVSASWFTGDVTVRGTAKSLPKSISSGDSDTSTTGTSSTTFGAHTYARWTEVKQVNGDACWVPNPRISFVNSVNRVSRR